MPKNADLLETTLSPARSGACGATSPRRGEDQEKKRPLPVNPIVMIRRAELRPLILSRPGRGAERQRGGAGRRRRYRETGTRSRAAVRLPMRGDAEERGSSGNSTVAGPLRRLRRHLSPKGRGPRLPLRLASPSNPLPEGERTKRRSGPFR